MAYWHGHEEEHGDRYIDIRRTISPLRHYDYDAETTETETESILNSDVEITVYSDQEQGDISPPRGRSHSRWEYVYYPSWDSVSPGFCDNLALNNLEARHVDMPFLGISGSAATFCSRPFRL